MFNLKNAWWNFYATLAYIRHFIFAGCYDNDPWYLVTNFAGHLDLAGHLDFAGFIFLNAPLILNRPHFHLVMEEAQVYDYAWAWTRAPPDRKLMLYQWAMEATVYLFCVLGYICQHAHIHVLADFFQ